MLKLCYLYKKLIKLSEPVKLDTSDTGHLKVINDEKVEIYSKKGGKPLTFSAEVDRDWDGEIEDITISEEEIKSIFSQKMAESGQSFFDQFNLNTDEFTLKIEINISDLECEVEDNNQLICELEVEADISARSK